MYWEDALRKELTREGVTTVLDAAPERSRILQTVPPTVPAWLATNAFEQGFDSASPVLVSFAHLLVHRTDGVHPSKLPLILSMARRMERTRLRGVHDVGDEVRRLMILLDATVRAFLPTIYEAVGDVNEAGVFRKLPPAMQSAELLVVTKLVVGFMEAELRNVTKRPPLTHHLFVAATRSTARLILFLDRIIHGVKEHRRIDAASMADVVMTTFSVYSRARSYAPMTETLDDYAVALLNLMLEPDPMLLSDLIPHAPETTN